MAPISRLRPGPLAGGFTLPPTESPASQLRSVPRGARAAWRWPLVLLLCFLSQGSRLAAATNLISADEIPPLLPPRPELPPTFWEQYGFWPFVAGAVALLLVATAVWVMLRPKPAPAIPPAAQARAALAPLRQEAETGLVLSRVSQIVRGYFANAFGLPPEEFTTTEFCQALGGLRSFSAELAAAVGAFLRECDRRKFAPAVTLPPLEAAAKAETLITQAETHRAGAEQSPPR
jgi:hypothetical protein